MIAAVLGLTIVIGIISVVAYIIYVSHVEAMAEIQLEMKKQQRRIADTVDPDN